MAYALTSLGRCKICIGLLVFMIVMPLLIFLYALRGFVGVKMLFNTTAAGDYLQLIPRLTERPLTLKVPMVRGYVDLVLLLIFLLSGFYAVFTLGGGVEKGYVFLDMVAAGGRLRGLARIAFYTFLLLAPASAASGVVLLLVLRVLLGVAGDLSPAFWSVLRTSIAGFIAGVVVTLYTGERGLALFSLLAFTSALIALDTLLNLAAGERFFTALFALPDEAHVLAYPLLVCILIALSVWGVVRLEARS